MSDNIKSYVVIKQEPLGEENNEVILPDVTSESVQVKQEDMELADGEGMSKVNATVHGDTDKAATTSNQTFTQSNEVNSGV